MNILIVRLGALGDIVHAVPAAAALRHEFPDARIDWLVESKHRPIVDLVTCIDRVVPLERPSVAGWLDVSRRMQEIQYDVAIDFQGLMKSAVLARASGAPRVIGFSIWHLREKAARPFYSEIHRDTPTERADHVVRQNLALLQNLGVDDMTIRFPFAEVHSDALAEIRTALGDDRPFALINPGAAWPNKRWPPERYGQVAAAIRERFGWPSLVLWGPREQAQAMAVVDASDGAAMLAPPTSIVDLFGIAKAARLAISGDTGPRHIA